MNATAHLDEVGDRAAFDGVFFPGGHGPMFDILATDATTKACIRSRRGKAGRTRGCGLPRPCGIARG